MVYRKSIWQPKKEKFVKQHIKEIHLLYAAQMQHLAIDLGLIKKARKAIGYSRFTASVDIASALKRTLNDLERKGKI